MKKMITITVLFVLLVSCIPLRIAPTINDYKVTKGKKFKRSLPKKTIYVFQDPKEADEFYNYINIKFDLKDYYVDVDVPFYIEDRKYAFSFYEVEIPTKTLNLLPIFTDVLLSRADVDPVFENAHESRIGNFYIAIEVYDDLGNDMLLEESTSRKEIVQFLSELKHQYLNTHNYNEVVFKN